MKLPNNKKIAIGLLIITILTTIIGIVFLISGYFKIFIIMEIIALITGYFVSSLWSTDDKETFNQSDYIIYRKIYRYASDTLINKRFLQRKNEQLNNNYKNTPGKKAEWNALEDETKLRGLRAE